VHTRRWGAFKCNFHANSLIILTAKTAFMENLCGARITSEDLEFRYKTSRLQHVVKAALIIDRNRLNGASLRRHWRVQPVMKIEQRNAESLCATNVIELMTVTLRNSRIRIVPKFGQAGSSVDLLGTKVGVGARCICGVWGRKTFIKIVPEHALRKCTYSPIKENRDCATLD
jgi:hypothetical protein